MAHHLTQGDRELAELIRLARLQAKVLMDAAKTAEKIRLKLEAKGRAAIEAKRRVQNLSPARSTLAAVRPLGRSH